MSADALIEDLQYIGSLYLAVLRSVGHRGTLQNYLKNLPFLRFIAAKHHGKDFMVNFAPGYDLQRKEEFLELFQNQDVFDQSEL